MISPKIFILLEIVLDDHVVYLGNRTSSHQRTTLYLRKRTTSYLNGTGLYLNGIVPHQVEK